MLNCIPESTCSGGYSGDVWRLANTKGAVHATCEQYVADDFKCTDINTCKMCTGTVPSDPTGTSTCTAVTDNTKYYAVNVKEFAGPFAMKSDIYKNGPISCGIDATAKFEAYRGGIFSEEK